LTEAQKGGSGSSVETSLARTRPSAPCSGTSHGEVWSASFLPSPSLLRSNGSSARRSPALANGGVGEDAAGGRAPLASDEGAGGRWQRQVGEEDGVAWGGEACPKSPSLLHF
jgi:hypothetical protein